MSVPPESIEAGKCYLLERLHVSRVCLVTDLMPGSSLRFEWRDASGSGGVFIWTTGSTDLRTFASEVFRELPCDWTPEKRKGWW